MKNRFTVDLGDVKLPDNLRDELDQEIRSAVLAKLARAGMTGGLAFSPIKGPLINGIIVRDLDHIHELTQGLQD